MGKLKIPDDIDLLKDRVRSALGGISEISDKTQAEKSFLFNAKRTDAGRSLPPYYLVFFLFNDLLGFRNLGRFEKIDWSFPIDYQGKAFLIEHRKFGVGVFAQNLESDEQHAQIIVKNIHKAVKTARPYFEWVAKTAVQQSKLNVKNNNFQLFERYEYLKSLYQKERNEAISRKDERIKKTLSESSWTIEVPSIRLERNANWLATAVIEAFFSWTEHLFVHLSIIAKGVSDGEAVAKLASAEWQHKYKFAIGLETPESKSFFDELVVVRRQQRNFIAHGAFGKKRETFTFHSNAGAVPVVFPYQKGKNKFSLYGEIAFNEEEVINLIERFISFLWKSDVQPAMYYTMESGLPSILTMAQDGTYLEANRSMNNMEKFVEHLSHEHDRASNMDW